MATAFLQVAPAFVKMALSIERMFGFGPNPLNVPAAQIEQIFEVASDNIHALLKAGKISQAQELAGQNYILNQGTVYYNQKIAQVRQSGQDASPLVNGLANMTRTIQAETINSHNFPGGSSSGLTTAIAHQYYIAPNSPGWYPQSVIYGAQVADAFVQDISGSILSSVAGTGNSAINDIFSGTAVNPGVQQSGLVTPPATGGNSGLLIAVAAGLIVAKLSHFI